MEIRLLGPVRGWRDGRCVDLGPRQQRYVLAVLALEVNRMVHVDRLVELVWSGAPPRTAWQAVRVYVCRLRRIMGGRAPLVTEGRGYALRTDPLRVDAHRFRAMVGQASASADDAEKVRLYRLALALWHGPALADLTGAPTQPLAGGLHEHRLAATEECLDAELRLGRHLAVLAELTDLVAQYPDQQRFVAQLMIALYRCGRHLDSLAVYRAARSTLADRYGLDPEPRLRALELAVLRTDPWLDAPARPRTAAGGPAPLLGH